MKRHVLLVCGAWTAACAWAGMGVTGAAGEWAVVVEEKACPVVCFAAAELTNGLSRTLGAPVPVVTAPQPGKANVVLGENRWSRVEGLDPKPLVRDGFLQLAKGDRVYLLGVDDAWRDPRGCFTGSAPLLGFERGTLNAVYDFLERYADARFFFPGELGTLFVRKAEVEVPEGLVRREPAFTERYFGWWNTAKDGWYDASVTVQKATAQHWLRLRFGSARRQCCHGQRAFHLVARYGKEHPEWFCLEKDGKRNLTDTGGEPSWHNSKFCYTSPIREAIYQDVKAFLSGQPASSRGLKAWGASFVKDRAGDYVDIMPEDGFHECYCTNCQAAYDKSQRAYATDLIWKMTAEIAARLQREGVPGGVSQMAYCPYDALPSFALPTNIQVMVAVPGPWAAPDAKRHAAQLKRLKDWSGALGHKVWLWTYPGKYNGKMKGIPEVTPRAYAKFWSEAAPYVIGGYCDNDTDRFMYEVLNLYVFAKLAWDPQADVDALLADWNARLFGAAKDEMAAVYGLLESKWVNEISRGRVIESALGPVTVAPSSGQLWGDIYTGRVIADLRRHFDAAARPVPSGSPEARRVALLRTELFDNLARQSEEADPSVELARRRREKPVSLIPNGDCDSKDGWEKSYAWGTTEVDSSVKVTGRASLRLTSDTVPHRERNVQADACVPVCLSASKTYRLSYFIRLKDVAPYDPSNGAGLCLWLSGGHYIKHPTPLMKGTSDWIHQSHVFTPPVDAPKAKLQFRLEDSLGTMWIDGVLLEEVRR